MAISGNQIKAARALVGMEQSELSEKAAISIDTIRNMEAQGLEVVRFSADTLYRVKHALQTAGVSFVAENGEGAGVRLKGPSEELMHPGALGRAFAVLAVLGVLFTAWLAWR
jgi:transcriptional regulator with XRE-family HTH domain